MTKQDYLILRRRIHQLLPLSATLFNLGQITIELPEKVTKLEQLLKISINDDPITNYNHMHKLEIEIQAKLAHLSRQYRHIETSGRETKWLSSSTLRPLHLYHPLRQKPPPPCSFRCLAVQLVQVITCIHSQGIVRGGVFIHISKFSLSLH